MYFEMMITINQILTVSIANNQAKLDMKLPRSSCISFFCSESYLGCLGISRMETLYNMAYYDKALIIP